MTVLTDTWNKKVSPRWSVAGNWSGGVPVKGENVVIAPATALTVTFNVASLAVGALTLEGGTLNLTGGTLTVSTGATLKAVP